MTLRPEYNEELKVHECDSVMQGVEDWEPEDLEDLAALMLTTITDKRIEGIAYSKFFKACSNENKFQHERKARRLFCYLKQYLIRVDFKDHALYPLVMPLFKAAGVHDEMKYYIMHTCLLYLNETQLINLLNAAKIERFDFWDFWNSSDQPPSEMDGLRCPVTEAIVLSKAEHLNILLNYGFQKKKGQKFVKDRFFRLLKHRCQHVQCPDSTRNDMWQQFYPAVVNLDDRSSLIFEMFYYNYLCKTIANWDVKCLYLLWKSLSYPLTTSCEMYNVMKKILGIGTSMRIPEDTYEEENALTMVCNLYEVIFTGVPAMDNVRPRSLKHLCRCTIRKALTEAWRLPEGVQKLELSQDLMDYILLKV